MKFVICHWLLLGSFLLLSGCGLFRQKPEPIKVDRTMIGTIDSVRGEEFVLIRLNNTLMPPAGATLVSQGEAGPANLELTGEKIGLFIAADIRSGTPLRHDPVFLYQKLGETSDDDDKEGGLTYPEEASLSDDEAEPQGSHADSALPSRTGETQTP